MKNNVKELYPITRIEGSMKVSIALNDDGNVENAHANVLEFRGFESFLKGRHISKAPTLVTRICGVCPVPHHLVSLKAIENGLGIEPSDTIKYLREIMLASEHVSDHLLHMFFLAGPDILLPDLPPEKRGLITVYEKYPKVVKDVFSIRETTQSIISALGIQAVHPLTVIPGCITKTFTRTEGRNMLQGIKEGKKKLLSFHDDVLLPRIEKSIKEYEGLGRLNSNFVGLVKGNDIEIYDGLLRVVDPNGEKLAEFKPEKSFDYISERVVDYTYAKSAYLKKTETKNGMYRTGPIGRVNVAKSASTEYANKYLKEFKSLFGDVAQETLALNYARYISTVYAIERVEALMEEKELLVNEPVKPVDYKEGEGISVIEAPRGVLLHHYKWNKDGYITSANIITPTNGNSYAIDSSLKGVAERSIKEGKIDENQLENDIGMTIRAYDPCLSCATHTSGDQFIIEITDARGKTIQINK